MVANQNSNKNKTTTKDIIVKWLAKRFFVTEENCNMVEFCVFRLIPAHKNNKKRPPTPKSAYVILEPSLIWTTIIRL